MVMFQLTALYCFKQFDVVLTDHSYIQTIKGLSFIEKDLWKIGTISVAMQTVLYIQYLKRSSGTNGSSCHTTGIC